MELHVLMKNCLKKDKKTEETTPLSSQIYNSTLMKPFSRKTRTFVLFMLKLKDQSSIIYGLTKVLFRLKIQKCLFIFLFFFKSNVCLLVKDFTFWKESIWFLSGRVFQVLFIVMPCFSWKLSSIPEEKYLHSLIHSPIHQCIHPCIPPAVLTASDRGQCVPSRQAGAGGGPDWQLQRWRERGVCLELADTLLNRSLHDDGKSWVHMQLFVGRKEEKKTKKN